MGVLGGNGKASKISGTAKTKITCHSLKVNLTVKRILHSVSYCIFVLLQVKTEFSIPHSVSKALLGLVLVWQQREPQLLLRSSLQIISSQHLIR